MLRANQFDRALDDLNDEIDSERCFDEDDDFDDEDDFEHPDADDFYEYDRDEAEI